MMQLPPELIFDLVQAEEVPAVFDLETKGFPADEVTPIEHFIMRQELVPSLFLGAFMPSSTTKFRRIPIGFACATRSLSPTFMTESMKTHDPEGSSVCIQNVVVSTAYQRRGIALALVEQIIAEVRNDGLTKRLLLICRDNARAVYEKAGFEYVGVSPVVLGARPWDEMRLVLKEPARSSSVGPPTVNGIARLLPHESTPQSSSHLDIAQQMNGILTRSSSWLLSSFARGLSEVTTDTKGVKSNKYDILCPRIGCDCIILKSNAGHLVEKYIPELNVVEQSSSSLSAPLPALGTRAPCWLVQPSPMAFENIGLSHSLNQGSASQDSINDDYAHNLLKQEFPEGEAATLEQFKMRQEFAPSLFLGAFLPPPSEDSKRVIIGFVCATRSKLPTSTGESIEKHDPNGSSVCIHAVVVASQYQRCGIALALLKEYVARMRIDGSTNRLLLICNENTRALYEKAGFEYVEPSPVVHGPLPWGEMRIILDDIQGEKKEEEPRNAESQSPSNTLSGFGSEPLPPGLLEALQRSISSRNRPSARLLSSFLGSVDDVTNDSDGVKSNKYGILCPRLGCGCLILKAGVGTLVEKELPELEQAGKPPAGLLATLPPTGRSVSCWLVQPNPMVFENICFSRAIDRGTGTQGRYLGQHVDYSSRKLIVFSFEMCSTDAQAPELRGLQFGSSWVVCRGCTGVLVVVRTSRVPTSGKSFRGNSAENREIGAKWD
ncbi:hypothetical protein ACEPAF_5900 [Sanghuangporus sanghuang]